jgi:hypothetical protein
LRIQLIGSSPSIKVAAGPVSEGPLPSESGRSRHASGSLRRLEKVREKTPLASGALTGDGVGSTFDLGKSSLSSRLDNEQMFTPAGTRKGRARFHRAARAMPNSFQDAAGDTVPVGGPA